MTFYPTQLRLPGSLETADFQLQPLTPAHVEIDYEAVMSSREMLNLWSGSRWPAPDFTLAENLADLEWHDREHRRRIAFTYTILNPAGSKCLGCLYIRPLSELATQNPEVLPTTLPNEAIYRFWVRSSRLADRLDQRVLPALITWFDEQWDFPRVSFHIGQGNKQQVALFETSNLTHRFDLEMPQRGGIHQFWSDTLNE